MTDELTTKLKEVLHKIYGYPEELDPNITYLSQAFIADGWVKPIMLNREQSYDATKNPVYKTPILKSGKEWYDKMMDAIHDQPDAFLESPDYHGPVVLCYPIQAVDRAAKQVAGLKETK